MIKNYIFDMGGVLPKSTMTEYMKSISHSEAEFTLYQEMTKSNTWVEMDRGLDIEEACQIFCEQYHHKQDEKIRKFVGNFRQSNDPNPEMEQLILESKNHGYKLYLMSNVSFLYKKFFPYIKSISYMDGIWVSCEQGLIKPDRRAFEDMFHMFGLTPEECFFIDDSVSNIDAGRLCGMDGMVYRGNVAELRSVIREQRRAFRCTGFCAI